MILVVLKKVETILRAFLARQYYAFLALPSNKISSMNKKITIGLLAALSVALFFVLRNKEAPTKDETNILISIKNNIEKRKFIEPIAPKQTIEYPGKGFLIFQNHDSLWLVDNYENKIIIYDKNFNELSNLGKSGDSPAENSGIKHASFYKDGYFTFDHSQQMIKYFSINDSLRYYTNLNDLKLYVSDCVYISESTFLVAGSLDDNKFVVATLDAKKKEIIKLTEIEPIVSGLYPEHEISQKGIDLIFEGYFSKGNSDKILYSFNKIGAFLLFDKAGNHLDAIKTIDELPIPQFALKDIGNGVKLHTVVPDYYGNFSRSIDEDYVYVLSNFLLPEYQDRRPIDIYDVNNGKYVSSILIDNLENGERPDQISVFNRELFILFENASIGKYRI